MSAEKQPAAGTPDNPQTGIQATPPNSPASITGTQTAPTPEAPPIPLPPPRPSPVTVEDLGRSMRRMDVLIYLPVLVLAVLVSLFNVRNSDIWLHLATGRAIVGGHAGPTTEPFSYTADRYWVNHSWLYDVISYALYQPFGPEYGGVVLLGLKALLILALAVVMLRTSRRGQSLWIPAVCTLVAILALSPRALLQPTVVSFFFLGVTFYLLSRRGLSEPLTEEKRRSAPPPPWTGDREDRPLWLLPPLFALWVNLDSWFFLGPLAVVLYLFGEVLQEKLSAGKPLARPGAWRPLAAVAAAGVVACLLSPFHIYGLGLPAELGGDVVTALQRDEMFRRIFISPWASEYFDREARSIAGSAYHVLALLGALSFYVNRYGWRWGRALVWLGFLALSAYYARAVPYFAVVGGPIAALNFQEAVARRFGTAPRLTGLWREWSILGRFVTILLVLAAVVAAWPGYLHGFPNEDRHVGLSAAPDPSLVRLAELFTRWRAEGKLPEGAVGMHLSPESTNTLAWLCPPDRPEKAFFDLRYGLYSGEVADEFVKAREAFGYGRRGKERTTASPGAWEKLFQKWKITYLVVYAPSTITLEPVASRLWNDRTRWSLLHLDGHAVVFGLIDPPLPVEPNPFIENLKRQAPELASMPTPFRKPAGGGPYRGLEYDPAAYAFGPKAEPLASQPPPLPLSRPLWRRVLEGPGSRPAAADDALMLQRYFEDTAFQWHYEHAVLPWMAVNAANLVGLGSLAMDTPQTRLGAWVTMRMKARFEGPPLNVILGDPAPALLAIRAGRRAVLANPDNPAGYYLLGQGYSLLRWQTEERHWASALTLLHQVRQAQMAAAFRTAVTLQPDFEAGHAALTRLYSEMNYRDLVLKHLGEQLRLARATGPLPGESSRDFNQRLKDAESQYKALEKSVKDDQNSHAVKMANQKVLDKARRAVQMGLAETALKVLLDSDAVEFGPPGAQLELQLLLTTGDIEKLRVLLAPGDEEHRAKLSAELRNAEGPSYEIYRIGLAAAEGDYETADRFLDEAARGVLTDPAVLTRFRQILQIETPGKGGGPDLPVHQLPAVAFAKVLMQSLPEYGPVAWLLLHRIQRDQLFGESGNMIVPLEQYANIQTVRGILALEAGHTAEARKHFREALYRGTDAKEPVLDFAGRPAALRYLEMLEGRPSSVGGP